MKARFLPDEKSIAAFHTDLTLRVWDVAPVVDASCKNNDDICDGNLINRLRASAGLPPTSTQCSKRYWANEQQGSAGRGLTINQRIAATMLTVPRCLTPAQRKAY